jgi:hypothetical protein
MNLMKRTNIMRKGLVVIAFFAIIAGIAMAGSDNEQPFAQAVSYPKECLACECKVITLDGSGSSDRYGQIVRYDWYYYDINNNLKFIASGKTASLGKEFCDNPGTYRIKLIATDNDGATDDYEFDFIVISNSPPIIKEIRYTNEEFFITGDNITVTVIMESKSKRKLDYAWFYDPDVFQKNGDGEKVVFKVIANKVFKNNYKIGVVVSNACKQESRKEEIELEVRPLELKSSLKTEIILPLKINEEEIFSPRSSYVPEAKEEIYYLWNLSRIINGKEALIKQSKYKEPSFFLDDSEVYKITLEIRNNNGAKGSASADFGVANTKNDKPIANASATQRQVLQGEEIILNGSLSLDDGEIISYCWLDKSYEEKLECSKILKVTFHRSGLHEIVLTVTDDGLPKRNINDFPQRLSDTDTVMINVIKSANVATSQTPAQAVTAIAQPPTPIKTYIPLNPQPLPPKESNKIPGEGIAIAITAIIMAAVFIMRRGKK